MDFIKNLKISDDDKEEQKPVAAPAPAKAEDESFFDKIGDALGRKQTPPPPPPPPPTAARPDGLFDKLGDALKRPSTPPPAPAPVKEEEEESFFDKIGEKLGRKQTPPPPPPPETNILDKLKNKISGKDDAPPPEPEGLFDKINHAMGGGAAGEAKEGKLDKTIDFFQEHLLKKGAQDNESAMEQLKDKKIADTIRKTLGLPDKDDDKK